MNNQHLLKSFSKYVGLNILGMLAMSCYILADTFFVAAALGPDGLTALNFCISIFSILQGFGLMFGIGGATRYVIEKTSGEQKNADTIFTHTILLGVITAFFFVIIGIFFSTPLLTTLGADNMTLPLGKTYLTTLLCFAPCFLVNNILLAFIRNDNQPRLSMAAMIISSFSNILLDYIFMFPLSMGMFGAAFATGLSPVISIAILSTHLIKKRNGFHLCIIKINVKKIIDICLLGLSSMIGELSSAIALITFNLVILKIAGNMGVAAYGIVANIALVATAIFTGVAQGIQPLVSQSYGQNKKAEGRKIYQYAKVTSLCLALVIYLVIYTAKTPIAHVFNRDNDQLLTMLAVNGLEIYFAGFFFAGINIVTAAYLSASNRPRAAFTISIMRSLFLIVPAVIILSGLFEMTGVWLAFVATEAIVCVISVVRGRK